MQHVNACWKQTIYPSDIASAKRAVADKLNTCVSYLFAGELAERKDLNQVRTGR